MNLPDTDHLSPRKHNSSEMVFNLMNDTVDIENEDPELIAISNSREAKDTNLKFSPMVTPNKSNLSHSYSHPNLSVFGGGSHAIDLVKTPKRSISSNMATFSPLELDFALGVSKSKLPKLTPSFSANSISSLDSVPELSASNSNNSLNNISPSNYSNVVTPNRAHQRGSSLTYFTPVNTNTNGNTTNTAYTNFPSGHIDKSGSSSSTHNSVISPTRLSLSSGSSISLAPASVTRRKRSNTYTTNSRLRHKLSLDMLGAKSFNGSSLPQSASSAQFKVSGVNPFYNPHSSFASPTKYSPLNTPLPTPNKDEERNVSPFNIDYFEDRDDTNATITESKSNQPANESTDTIGELNSLMQNFSDSDSTFHGDSNASTMDLIPGMDKYTMDSHMVDQNNSYTNEIFLQAADMTLKMASRKPHQDTIQTVNIDSPLDCLNYLDELHPRMTRSEGSINLKRYINNAKPLSFTSQLGSLELTSLPNIPLEAQHHAENELHGMPPHSQTIRQTMSQTMSQPANLNQLREVSPLVSVLPAGLKLPEGLDESKLTITKSKRGRKSTFADDKKPKKNHECPLCGSKFQRPEHVKRHMRSHSSEKPYQCDQPNCTKRFNRSDNLKAHLRKIHKLAI